MKKVLALNVNGDMTYCTCPPDLRGKGRCNHVAHQMENESAADFVQRISEMQERLQNGGSADETEDLVNKVTDALFDDGSDEPFGKNAFIPYDGTTVVLKPYRMTDDEKKVLQKIENRMQLDQNIDGGYMELEEPLWNDMDKNYFCQISGMKKKNLEAVLHGDAQIIIEGTGRYKRGRVIPNETLETWEKEGYPAGWDQNAIHMETGVVAMNNLAARDYAFVPTKDVFVLPYYMRMGIADHTPQYESSATENSVVGEMKEDAISSDITVAYKYMLRQHANPQKQQLAYEALLNNQALSDKDARFTNGFRNKSLADEFAGKGGVFRAVMSGGSIPYSGRAVITPNADLKFGECAIPASMAIDIFRPTLLDQLTREGKNVEEIDQWMSQYRVPQGSISKKAKKELEERIHDRRVALCRQPSLHQPSFQSFRPRISDGATIENNPLICKAYNADHDGDEMSCYGFNQEHIIPILDRSIDASLDVNTKLPRHQDTMTILPTKDSLFGIISILEQRDN